MNQDFKELNSYQTIVDIINKYPQFSINQLRWIVVNKERYGLSNAIKRIGKKLYFHMPTFVDWVDSCDA